MNDKIVIDVFKRRMPGFDDTTSSRDLEHE